MSNFNSGFRAGREALNREIAETQVMIRYIGYIALIVALLR